jgi:hypothetical protein
MKLPQFFQFGSNIHVLGIPVSFSLVLVVFIVTVVVVIAVGWSIIDYFFFLEA